MLHLLLFIIFFFNCDAIIKNLINFSSKNHLNLSRITGNTPHFFSSKYTNPSSVEKNIPKYINPSLIEKPNLLSTKFEYLKKISLHYVPKSFFSNFNNQKTSPITNDELKRFNNFFNKIPSIEISFLKQVRENPSIIVLSNTIMLIQCKTHGDVIILKMLLNDMFDNLEAFLMKQPKTQEEFLHRMTLKYFIDCNYLFFSKINQIVNKINEIIISNSDIINNKVNSVKLSNTEELVSLFNNLTFTQISFDEGSIREILSLINNLNSELRILHSHLVKGGFSL